jgi:hypothetical protein
MVTCEKKCPCFNHYFFCCAVRCFQSITNIHRPNYSKKQLFPTVTILITE